MGSPLAEEVQDADNRRQRYGLLLISTVALLGVQGIAPPGDVQEIVVAALAGLSLMLALRAADIQGRMVVAAAIVGVIVLAASIVRAAGVGIGEGPARLMFAALVALGPPAVAIGIVRDLRTSGEVRLQTLSGVLAFYMLIGMLFGFVFGAIDNLGGEPFFAGGEEATVSQCLYFSFTTLTTIGYGDLVARSDLGHTLAITEGLIGQIYLVTVVSLIVSNLGHPARRRQP